MGYYTKYGITMRPRQDEAKEMEIMREIATRIYHDDDLTDTDVEWCLDEKLKWYEYETDMREVSRHYPEVTFILAGVGEETGDMWLEYFKDGESEFCPAKIVYPEPKNPKFQHLT